MAEIVEPLIEEKIVDTPSGDQPSLLEAWAAAEKGQKIESPKPEEPKSEAPKPETPTTPEATAPKENTESSPNKVVPPTPDELPDEVFYGRLSKMTEGRFKSEEDFVGFVNDYNALVEEAEKGFQPQFKDERAKLAYQIIAENPGKEPEAAMRTLRALSFNASGKSAQEVLFEAYLIDPKNSDLSPSEAQRYFEAEYDASYSDVDHNPISQRRQALAVREAEQNLAKIKETFKPAEEQEQQPRVDLADWNNRINGAVDNFGGVKLAFSDNPSENDYLSMAIDESEIASLKEHTQDSSKWWNNFLEQFVDNGKFNESAFVQEFYEMTHHQKKAELAFQHGKKLGELSKINAIRNASDPKRVDQSMPSTPPAPSLMDAWLAAQKG